MLYKTYGQTGKKISAVSFGGMRFPNGQDLDDSAAIILHGYRQGINYFDTAPLYCDDKSEEIFGLALKEMTPGTYYVSTKSSHSDGDSLRAQLENSLRRLGVEKIDFFHIWCIVRPEHWAQRKAGGAVAAAQKARDEGLIEHLVFSSHMTGNQISEVIDEGIFEGVTLGYCAVNFPYRQAALAAAEKAEIGVVTMNPLGGGVIPANPERFDFIRAADYPNVVAAALRFNISHPAITSALVGFSSIDHVDQAVAAVGDDFKAYDGDHIAAMKTHIEESFDGLCTGCGYCLPCPQEIPIPQYMDAYNQKMLAGGDNALLGRLKYHWNLPAGEAGKCVECGACEAACTQQLPITERLAHIAALADEKQ